jgi:2-dehydro-3-deoxy-D-arabinonate dehydratase
MKLYLTSTGPVVEEHGRHFSVADETWDALVRRDDLLAHLRARVGDGHFRPAEAPAKPLAPIGTQEVWAAGVTYLRSKVARMEESSDAGGGSFYDRVYSADRPELFFKGTPHRVVGPGGRVRIRADSKWNVPEPELALLLSPAGRIIGYTIGNDMSSRDIEGENPLYLPQAKVYDGSCALGPAVLVAEREPLPKSTEIRLEILRAGERAFTGTTALSQMKRGLPELAGWLFRDSSFPTGCYLLTGTGIVPPDSFTLQPGDEVRITIEPIGTLSNVVA